MRKTVVVVLLASLAGTHLMANVIPPIGLAPGSSYQLIFVTADPHDGVNSSIAVYNSFVTNEAGLGVPFGLPSGATWNAVASTSTVDANFNAPSPPGALPVYNTAGQEVTAAGVGIYTGALDNLVGYDQFGNVATGAQMNNIWTGSDSSGARITGATIGGLASAEVGQLALDATWLQFKTLPKHVGEVLLARQFYALSSSITVPTPEPATITLLGMALLAFGGHHVLRWWRQPR
jgi:PEP-CTERM motif-containing protein